MFINPILLADKILSGTEKLDSTQIAAMTIVGLVVVFSALLVLVGYLVVSGGIFKKANRAPKPQSAPKKPAPVKAAPPPAKPQKPAPAAAPVKPAAASGEDEEVIAVIMAAIAAMSEADGTAYQIRSVKRVTRGGSGRSVWAQAGLSEATKPF